MKLEDIKGIKGGNGGGYDAINTTRSIFQRIAEWSHSAFQSVNGLYWYQRLHGFEPDSRVFDRKSFGNSHALYEPYLPTDPRLHQVLCELVSQKMGFRLRRAGFSASGIHIGCLYSDYTYWHKGLKLGIKFIDGDDYIKKLWEYYSSDLINILEHFQFPAIILINHKLFNNNYFVITKRNTDSR